MARVAGARVADRGRRRPAADRDPASPNVLRSGGAVPPPPRELPTFAGQAGLLPLGNVQTETGERMVGVPATLSVLSLFFTLAFADGPVSS